MVSALTRIFYPDLTRPQKEQYVDDGRKRIDILFHNSAVSGFCPHCPAAQILCALHFSRMQELLRRPSESGLDQLLGRLTRKRGFVGILTCRQIEDRNLMLKRCRDVVNNDNERVIIVLEDNDICAMLNFAAENKRKGINEHLEGQAEGHPDLTKRGREVNVRHPELWTVHSQVSEAGPWSPRLVLGPGYGRCALQGSWSRFGIIDARSPSISMSYWAAKIATCWPTIARNAPSAVKNPGLPSKRGHEWSKNLYASV